jgi:probable F420-dependent oxidoreductase
MPTEQGTAGRSRMRFGVMASGQMPDELPDPAVFRDIAETVEGLGYDSLWCGDHLSFGNPILEGIVGLAASAGYTRRITIGTGVLLLPLRHPGLVAKQMASLDYLTGGRVICGIGVGGESAKDFELVQVPMSERGSRTDEGIAVLRNLWSRSPADHRGTHFSFDGVALNPMPVRPGGPPIWVGGRSKAALRRAGTLTDGWMAYMVSPDRFAGSMTAVRGHAAAVGRDPDAITPSMMIPTRMEADGDAARESLRRHLGERYHFDFSMHQIEKLCLAGDPDELRRRLAEYAAAGVEHVIFLFGGAPSDAVEQFTALYDELASAPTALG